MSASARLAALIVIALAAPMIIPVANALHPPRTLPPTYLPALEGPRERGPFDADRLPDLRRLDPGYVVIGDSMAGTRIDERRLMELTRAPVGPLLQPGSGSAFWYLVLKNWVIASGVRPRLVLIFFRDTNLTDVLYRLDPQYRWSLDLAALDREDELNDVVARRLGLITRVHRFVDGVLHVEQVRQRVEPEVTTLPAAMMIASRRRREEFVTRMNDRLGLDHLRRMEAADIENDDGPELDFERNVDRSVLPLMLRDATRAGLRLCFVRVQRRPTAHRPPAQSPAMQRYVGALRTYVDAHGGLFHDDTGDPALTLDLYEDGDHLSRRARQFYTENLYNRLRPYLQ